MHKSIVLIIACAAGIVLVNSTSTNSEDPAYLTDELKFKLGKSEIRLPLYIYYNALTKQNDKNKKEEKLPLILCYPMFPGTKNEIEGMQEYYWGEGAKKRNIIIAYIEVGQYHMKMTTEDLSIIDILVNKSLERIKQICPVDEKKIIITGASMGAQVAFYAFNQNPSKFSGCVSMGGICPLELSNKLKDKHIYMIRGEKEDPMLAALIDEQVTDLKKIEAKVKYDILKGQPHIFDIDPKLLFNWIDHVISKPRLSNPKEGKCLICNSEISEDFSEEYKEKLYGFCSKKCSNTFIKNPDVYINTGKDSNLTK
ncbi:MAG: dienelactone hydrolase family protein [Planctomycetes bacterium]|nr:dienelactone hydrolase family protein [Planctomycetota bacterium]